MPTPENKKRAPKGGITFTEPFTIVFFQQDCFIRLLTSGYCPVAPSRSSSDNQWLPLTGCDLKLQLQRRDRHGITPCSVYKAVFMIPVQRYCVAAHCTRIIKTVNREMHPGAAKITAPVLRYFSHPQCLAINVLFNNCTDPFNNRRT
jgi:hypothetical protein